MGFDFVNRQGTEFRFSIWEWRSALELAREFGWKPRGTQAPPDYDAAVHGALNVSCFTTGHHLADGAGQPGKPWAGGYSTNDGQIVTVNDARALAAALEKALAAIDDFYELSATHAEIYHAIIQGAGHTARTPAPIETGDDGVPEMLPLMLEVAEFNCSDVHGLPRRHRAQILLESCERWWTERLTEFVAYCRRGDFQIW